MATNAPAIQRPIVPTEMKLSTVKIGIIPSTSTALIQSSAGEPTRFPNRPQSGSKSFFDFPNQSTSPPISSATSFMPWRNDRLKSILRNWSNAVPPTKIVAGTRMTRAGANKMPVTEAVIANTAIHKHANLIFVSIAFIVRRYQQGASFVISHAQGPTRAESRAPRGQCDPFISWRLQRAGLSGLVKDRLWRPLRGDAERRP